MRSILIVDDEKHTREGLIAALCDKYDTAGAANADEAFRLMDAQDFDAIITDLRMSGKSGLNVIDEAVTRPNKPACIMMTAYGNIDVAVEAMKHGASDFLTKPINIERLELVLLRTLRKRDENLAQNKTEQNSEQHSRAESSQQVSSANQISKKDKIIYSEEESGIIVKSDEMQAVIAQALKVAPSRATVMITGETGTGKELVAHFIHKNSTRKDKPFVPVHCAAIPSNLIESELFGFEKGAFTGAVQKKIGRFEYADKGTLFLDEIGEIDPTTQVKLLRFLETRNIERLGGLTQTEIDIRLICATNKNLKTLAQNGQFREDLYYRLNVVELRLPPLRERRADIAPLIEFYISKYAKENGAREVKIDAKAMRVLINYSWPGNIRELRNFCENAVVLRKSDTIKEDELDARFFAQAFAALPAPNDEPSQFAPAIILSKRENETQLIKNALASCRGNKTKAAEILGISRRTLHRKLEQARQNDEDFEA